MGRPVQAVPEILNGKKEITPETAVAISQALGTSAELWPNLQTAYRLHQVSTSKASAPASVERRARLRSLVPVRELQKRGWLPDTDEVDELERAMDGVVIFSGDNPVIGLSTRHDRMDSFVFTLLHEIAHLALEHVGRGQLAIDEEVGAKVGPEREGEANDMAARWIFETTPSCHRALSLHVHCTRRHTRSESIPVS